MSKELNQLTPPPNKLSGTPSSGAHCRSAPSHSQAADSSSACLPSSKPVAASTETSSPGSSRQFKLTTAKNRCRRYYPPCERLPGSEVDHEPVVLADVR